MSVYIRVHNKWRAYARSVPCALKGVYMSIDADQAQKCIWLECIVRNEKKRAEAVFFGSPLS